MTAKMMPGGAGRRRGVRRPRAAHREAASRTGTRPGSATLLVGDDDASARYVGMKHAQGGGARLSLASHVHLPDDATQADVLAAIARFNDDPAVDAMLVPVPPPPQIDFEAALLDGRPRQGRRRHAPDEPRSARARRCRDRCRARRRASRRCSRTTRSRSRAATCASSGRGVTLGRPLALLLSQKRPTANAAVTVVHTGVPDWAEYTRRADIVVAAAGVPGIIQPEHLTPGCVVVGGGVRYEGRKLLPDVDEACEEVAGCDHAARRRRRPHHHRHAVPQPGRDRRAQRGRRR